MGWVFMVGILMVFVGLPGVFGLADVSRKNEASAAGFGVVLLLLGSVTAVVSGGVLWGGWFCSGIAIPTSLPDNAADAKDRLNGLGFENVEFDGGDKAVLVAGNWSVRGSDPSQGTTACGKDTVTLDVSK
ncbi:hypothetical protein [Rhodococcus oryzae]|uniref:hypothetical protein n=1 Tax=Rhodococcus oryzae TaxID=2571143 RepID=UPI0037A06938